MSPKAIKAVGKVKKEPMVKAKERNSTAYIMAVNGTSSSDEHISTVDNKVKSGELTDNVSRAILIAFSKNQMGKKIDFSEFVSAVEHVFSLETVRLTLNPTFKARFDLNQEIVYVPTVVVKNKKAPKLDKSQQAEFDTIMAELKQNYKESRDTFILAEIDRFLAELKDVMKDEMIKAMDVDESRAKPLSSSRVEERSPHQCSCGGKCKNNQKTC